ncbi:sigma 54-interacting transcriptional regulator [Thermovenabulum gondwanense]|uniref:Arginine utilization regulatory protein RocR n=1 Tax=Thermovenabulum gondwanense TaxID=520767 RepID=A0A162MPQ9_9FIRM|nr:sigma 54-interacting transcriptional regulator [Thermovenabulum gondwanense]KYO66900.1 Arginine utilization regulatory protein RocR [Thermovenabulum gondwanense]
MIKTKFSDSEERIMLYTILENLREGVNVVDEKGNLLFVNKASASYARSTVERMLGEHISKYYPKAALLDVLKTKKPILDVRIEHDDGRKYIVNAVPLIIDNEFRGGVATFRDVTEIEELSQKLEILEMELYLSKVDYAFDAIIGKDGSLKEAILKAQRAIGSPGGPRHSIIVGESGTGKTMFAKAMYFFARKIGVIDKEAPFIEINCAQFTNPDIAAIEIFGSEKGAFTGALEKKGLMELANGGILFLDEAHALEHYQTMLLKVIETGKLRRIGGRKEIDVNVIIIAASTKNLRNVLLPELYQRLAQYEIKLPPLRERPLCEKEQLLKVFKENYEKNANDRYKIKVKVNFSNAAKEILLNAYYPRNIRQFRDIINTAIDASLPIISEINKNSEVHSLVDIENIPYDLLGTENLSESNTFEQEGIISEIVENQEDVLKKIILRLREKGMGPRKISNILKEKGFKIEYYKVAYLLKKLNSQRK